LRSLHARTARRGWTSPPSRPLTHHLDALEEAGLVVRTRDPHDRRAVRVELNDAGREKHVELMQAKIQELRSLLGKLERNVVSDETPAD
jgi:DNA-binding MarR family transcriptional regulator